MGYTTAFSGSFTFDRPLTETERDYINRMSETRRMKRDVIKLMETYKGEHGNPFAKGNTPEEIYGINGEYFALEDGNFGQKDDGTIIDHNNSGNQPGLWCQWVVNEEGDELSWDGGEKFYNYVEWLIYYIEHFFSKWGVNVNGNVSWEGEDHGDDGDIIVIDNVVTVNQQ